jgi:hypothetical protein
MDNEFTIEVAIRNEQLSFVARLDTIGFIHKIHIMVNGTEVVFEPDEERNYRAIVNAHSANHLSQKDKETIQAIGEALTALKD